MKHLSLPVACIFLLALFSPALPAFAAGPVEHVILVSIDGWAHHYYDDPRCQMPAVKKLAASGVRVKHMQTSFPTVTWTNHTTLVTGVQPGRHGVIGNDYFDREQWKKIPFIPDPIFNKDEIVKTATIYDLAKQAGLSTGAVCWPASRGAKTLDWTVPDVFDQELFEKYSTPELIADAHAAGIPVEKQMEWCKLGNPAKAQRDFMYTQLAQHIIRKKKPAFLALHLVSLDAFEHAHGRQVPESYWAANDSDNRVADLVRATEEAGIRDKTAFVITTDHGFITFTKLINPNVLLRQAGLQKVMLGKSMSKDSQVYAMAEGGACFVYVFDRANREKILSQITPQLAAIEGVAAIVESKDFAARVGHLTADQDAREPDLFLSAKDGYSFTDSFADTQIITATDGPKGGHGYLQTDPNMDGNCVISGAGVQQGKVIEKINNTDVAPTMAKLLGLEMLGVDGKVIEAALRQ